MSASDNGQPLIQARGLVKRFGELTAVDAIDFDLRRGEAFGFLGPNGAGKTSTMRMIGCVSPITDGTLRVFGLDPMKDGVKIRSRLGVVPQLDTLDMELTVRENIVIYGRYFGIPRRELAQRADELLEFVQLTERANDRVEPLSGGMKRRLTIARSLVNDPDVMLLDEPTTGLDPQARRNLWDVVREIDADGKTVVLTTHYMEEAEELCDRVAIVDRGRIRALDTPLALIKTLPNAYRIVFSTARELDGAELELLPGVAEVRLSANGEGTYELSVARPQETLEAFIAWAQANGVVADDLRVLPATLEDVFLALTGHGLRD